MKKTLKIIVLIGCLLGIVHKVNAGINIDSIKNSQLQKYSPSYTTYDASRLPFLMGNQEMGGLADPLGRGFFEIWLNDLWKSPTERMGLQGLMLESPQIINKTPVSYRQQLDISNGIQSTDVSYGNGLSYQSKLFFSMGDKHRFVMRIRNTGNSALCWQFLLPYQDFSIDKTDLKHIKATSPQSWFTNTCWSLQLNKPLHPTYYGQFNYVLEPGESLDMVYSVSTKFDGPDYQKMCYKAFDNSDIEGLGLESTKAWKKLWDNMATLVLPDEKYATVYYHSLFWMLCSSGADKFAASEIQFANFTYPMALRYGYFSDKVKFDVEPWGMHPFTYGTSGWAAFAYIYQGNKELARNILEVYYNPEALRWNAQNIFPIGKAKVHHQYGNIEYSGEHTYLNTDNPNAWCFGHELDCNFHNINYKDIGTVRWDWQLHLNAFAGAMFVRYYEYFGDTTFLRTRAYPILKGLSEFFTEMLKYDPKLKAYVLPPTLSLAEDHLEVNPIESVLSAKWILQKAAYYANQLGVDKNLREKWQSIESEISIPQNKEHYLEWQGDNFTREGGGYEGIRGFCYFGFPVNEMVSQLDRDKMRRTLDTVWIRNKNGRGIVTYTVFWYALTEALLGNSAMIEKMLQYTQTQMEPSSLTFTEVDGQRPYYHEGGILNVMLTSNMILQSDIKTIKLFPAMPSAWKDIEFYNLQASYGIKVSGIVKNGKTQWVSFTKDDKELLKLNEKRDVKIITNHNTIILKPL